MKYLKSTYVDPTGGGDDVTVLHPEWAQAPITMVLRDPEGGRMEFEYEDTEEVEDD